METSDKLAAAIGGIALIGYFTLVGLGEIAFEPGHVELLFFGSLVALGYDFATDYLKDAAEK